VKLTPLSKILIVALIVGGGGFFVYKNRESIAPSAKSKNEVGSNIPPVASLPSDAPGSNAGKSTPATPAAPPGCTDKPEVRFYHWAWNAQSGMMLATGGKQATADSLMCKNGVNLKLIREDNVDTMQSLMMTFAEKHKAGEAHPKDGAHFVAIMGDGSAPHSLQGPQCDRLTKLGRRLHGPIVVGSAGLFSPRRRQVHGAARAWKANPQTAAKGGVVAGYLRDGDWNIALKWLGDNRIPNNPDDKSYDPDALNWVNANDYLDAAEKYITGFCTDLTNKKTGKKENKCVQGVVTWTPGDVNVATKKGGLVSIVSTKEYRAQMPNVIIGHKKWMAANRDLVKGMLKSIFEAGDQIKNDPNALKKSAGISALVYNEADADYWAKYFNVVVEKDKQGLDVELGGSSVNNLADNLQTFGLVEGSSNLFGATYEVFANVVKSQYPDMLPTWYPLAQIIDTSYIKELAAASAPATPADLPKFEPAAKVKQVISRRSWSIEFESGKSTFTKGTDTVLSELLNDLLIAGGTLVEVHGHTDNLGSVDKNMALSEERAFAVKTWLERMSPANFPQGRIKVFAHGQSEPVESNATAAGKAKNRRVEIVLGVQ
jgi:OOP family OmpA-OmpF porin